MTSPDTAKKRLAALFRVVTDEADANPSFAAKLGVALGSPVEPDHARNDGAGSAEVRRSNRRAKSILEPFRLLAVSEAHLRAELQKLNIEQLKDIVAEYGMDTSRLALKWKSCDRLVDFIVTTVAQRQRKGDVFREGGGRSQVGTPNEEAPADKPDASAPPPSE